MKAIRLLIGIVFSLVGISGCQTVNPTTVISDHGFSIVPEIIWDTEHISHALQINLKYGEEGGYTFSYDISPLPSLQFMDTEGEAIASGSSIELATSSPLLLYFPAVSSDREHIISMEFKRNGIRRNYEVRLNTKGEKILNIDINTSETAESSILTITAGRVEAKTSYSLAFLLDGEKLSGVRHKGESFSDGSYVDFTGSEPLVFELPFISTGEHTLSVKASTEAGTHKSDIRFIEPIRFRFDANIEWDIEFMTNVIDLTLISGNEGDYTLEYKYNVSDEIIPQPEFEDTYKLKDISGNDFDSGGKIFLSQSTATRFILPSIPDGTAESISLTVKKGKKSYTRVVYLEDNNKEAFKIDVTCSDKELYSSVRVTSLRVNDGGRYSIAFKLDGTTLSGVTHDGRELDNSMTFDFESQSWYDFKLPYIASGIHTLTVTISTSRGSLDYIVTFTEPYREATSLVMAYNHYNGKLTLASPYNPFNTSFSVSIGITVKGSVTYRHKQFLGIAKEQTEYFTETGESSIRVKPGLTATAIDNGKLKVLMDKVFSNSRTDAANAIGNGNARTVYSDITSVDLKFTIHSEGELAGELPVKITPITSSSFPIRYQYTGDTWNHDTGYNATVKPTFTVNGKSASTVKKL